MNKHCNIIIGTIMTWIFIACCIVTGCKHIMKLRHYDNEQIAEALDCFWGTGQPRATVLITSCEVVKDAKLRLYNSQGVKVETAKDHEGNTFYFYKAKLSSYGDIDGLRIGLVNGKNASEQIMRLKWSD